MLKKTQIAIFVTTACTLTTAFADTTVELDTIEVQATVNTPNQMIQTQIAKKQPQDAKALFADSLEVSVNDLQNSRTGNEGFNVRGLQGNRVASSIDGVPLPEAQENKLFNTLGLDFGGANSLEPLSLRSATVKHGGSFQTLSNSVNFATLEAKDLIQSGNLGGFLATGYSSVDRSIYGAVGGAVKNDRYEGLLIVTGRVGHETKNKGEIGGEGETRTKPNPADYKNRYVLVKNGYQLNEHNKVNLTFEHQQKNKDTALLSSNGLSIDRATGIQLSGVTKDKNRRSRASLSHEYQNDSGWVNRVDTHFYFQNAKTENFRQRSSARSNRVEKGVFSQKAYGLSSNLMTLIDTTIPQTLRYGVAYHQTDFMGQLDCNTCSTGLSFAPVAKTTQQKVHLYIEDELAIGNFVFTPHLGVLHYRIRPSKAGYVQAAEQYAEVKARRETEFLPKISINWKIAPLFEPYFQYSRGVKTPSAQQLTSSFGNTVIAGGRVIRQYAVVGNGNLQAETANNFSLGFKGHNETVQYDISGYYNLYKHFIDWTTRATATYNPLIQYENLEKAKIYGVTASAKWHFMDGFYVNGGIAYSKGKAKKADETFPINTIQPLKLKAGLGYEREVFGANVQLTHIKAKADKDIHGEIYNPTRNVNLVDLGFYWKPLKNLTLSANVNNVFNKKYWNWADISYFAIQSSSAAAGPSASSFTANNADTYSAPGRNFNLGLRYEF
ncbi:TonB-dependent hemoglobin/transferrin/lactoferrin family receptor [Conservatibacter flavescens]|uniref:TonB-dependent receptor n=1 Tax=Conservatibacter flavescens TaxID=28161 RepID=A0A2M8S1M7_9PAST|nr:TonB-dependent hemoglobin/transferrin/lactoferrin family receptor [Conservatibacter flavescens]PJG85060.1 TonB-dependent receptor [Conservatibacter flavescens]